MKTMYSSGYHQSDSDFVAYYVRLASLRLEHSVCRGSLMTTYIMLLAWFAEHSLIHCYQQCVTVDHVSKCMSFHKAILVTAGRAHCFHDCIRLLDLLKLFASFIPAIRNRTSNA